MIFKKRGKLSPRFVGPFEVPKHVGLVTYCFAQPFKFSSFSDVFQVSILKKYHYDSSHIILYQQLLVRSDMTYLEYPVEIIDRQVRVLKSRMIPMVKVILQYHSPDEATWELEDKLWDLYPELF